MKLLFDCTELSYMNETNGHRAGVFNVAYNLFEEFKNRDVELTFYCNYKRYYFMKEILQFKNINMLEEHSLMNKFLAKILYITRKFPIHIQHALAIFCRLYDAYLYNSNKNNIEQIRLYDAYFSPFAAPSKDIVDSKILKFRMIHDTIPLLDNPKLNNPMKWYYSIYSSINAKDFYLTNSECTKKDLLTLFPFISEANIRTTYLGANSNFKRIKTNKSTQKYIFSLCTLGKRKNLIFAIRNFFEFIKRNDINDVKLVLAGGIWTKFEKELKNTIGVFDKTKIELLGYVPDDDLPELYSNALVFIYPSLYEGFGLPVLEAMQCGCPVITSNVSSLPEVIGDAGIKVNPTCDEDMIQAYEKMYNNTFFRELCSERGLIRSQKFSWQKCADEILNFIDEKIIK